MKIVIVGGVAGGASAAARARRLSEEAEIIMFERGDHISFANCGLPYHIGGAIVDRDRLLVTTPAAMRAKFAVDVRVRTEVLSVDRERSEVLARDLVSGREYRERYDSLILSPGAAPVRPPIKGINSEKIFSLRNLSDMDAIIAGLKDKSRAVVIGGGYIGLEMAEALRERGRAVTLIELAEQVMGPADPEMAAPLHRELVLNGVDLRLGVSVTAFAEQDDSLKVTLSNGEVIDTDLAILAIGVKPEVDLAKNAGLELGKTGGIKVDAKMRTSDSKIYAVGDAVEVIDFSTGEPALIPLAGPANRQGRIAADVIFGRDSLYRQTQGTAICKVFGLSIAMTGLSEKSAKRCGIKYDKVFVHPASHASYYPGARQMTLKMLFEPQSGKVLGAQAVGADGVDKRIDVIATALRAGMTVFDLEQLELSYAPPFGSAKDPVNYAGFVASNIICGDSRHRHVDSVMNLKDNQILLDVRNPEEVAAGTIGGSKLIPLPELRGRLKELPRDKEIIVFCAVGLRGYLATRILLQHGYNAANLDGGFKTYTMVAHPEAIKLDRKEIRDDSGSENGAALNKVEEIKPVEEIDARGLQCPGPIMQLKKVVDQAKDGEAIAIVSTDPGFASDIPAWCNSTGNRLQSIAPVAGVAGEYRAVVVKQAAAGDTFAASCNQGPKRMTNVVFSNDFDKAMAAFIIANGAAAAGQKVTLFFTFWGLSLLRKEAPVAVRKNLIEKMFGWMLPKGTRGLKLSKMHMAGMGTAMMKGVMSSKNVSPLRELMDQAIQNGVRMVACTMTMDVMGLKHEELIDGIEEGGVALFVDEMAKGGANLFI